MPLQWLAPIASDVDRLRALGCADGVGPLRDDAQSWHALASDEAAWARLVHEVFFSTSILDRQAPPSPDEGRAGRILAFECQQCQARFPSARALASHCRAKHKERASIKRYIDGSGICPACGTRYSTRQRCIAHLSDLRRPRCRAWVLKNCSPLPAAALEKLDEVDRAAMREAWSRGHTRPLSTGPAVLQDGTRRGHMR